MTRSRLVFLVIVGAAVLLVLVSVALDQINNAPGSSETVDNANNLPLELRIAVSPMASEWIETAAQAYNSQRQQIGGRAVVARVERQDSLPVWNTPGQWTAVNHPDIWIPETSQAVAYANDVGMRFSIEQPSVASTAMVWGAPTDRAQVLITQYRALNWQSVRQASVASLWDDIGGQADWRFVKPGFAQPNRHMSGVAAVLIATAEFHQQTNLNAALLNDPELIAWLRPVFDSVPSFANLGTYPAKEIATRGSSVADIALLPESEWLANYQGLTARSGAWTFAYPDYQYWFDFPFAVWNDADTTEPERSAAQSILDFLLTAEQQRRAAGYGLRQADGIPADADLFERAAGAGITLTKPGGATILLPDRSALTPFVNRDWTAF